MNKKDLLETLAIEQSEWHRQIKTTKEPGDHIRNARAMGVIEGLKIAIQAINEVTQ
ncbi:MAG: hypothetical protein RR198_08300 [Oscillospiraceae bacterium]